MLKEIDPIKLAYYGKLFDNEDDLSTVQFIKKEKSKLIFKKFATRR